MLFILVQLVLASGLIWLTLVLLTQVCPRGMWKTLRLPQQSEAAWEGA